MKKFFKSLALILLVLPAMFIFTACGTPTVIDIQKTNTTEAGTVYTIYYSNGTTSSITVQNGKDGQSIDVEALFQLGVTKGYYTDDLTGYQKFLTDLVNGSASEITAEAGVGKAMQSAVSVYAKFPVDSHSYPYYESEILCGAGVIYKMDNEYSYIITNYHVLYDGSSLNSTGYPEEVYIYQYGVDVSIQLVNKDYVIGGAAVKCSYIGGSMNFDIAVLRVNTADLIANNANTRAVDVATGYSVSETIYAIGNPEGDGISVTKGVISVESETVEITAADGSTDINFRVLRMDTAINGGNSGGGVYNQNGELVGIANAKLVYASDKTPIEGMSYALPYDNVTKVADNIMHYYAEQNSFSHVLKLQLGITYKTQNSKQIYNVNGSLSIVDEIAVTESPKVNTIAYEIGLKQGDIITHLTINDKIYVINRSFELGDLLLTVRSGDKIVITYTRNGESNLNSGAHTVTSTELKEIS